METLNPTFSYIAPVTRPVSLLDAWRMLDPVMQRCTAPCEADAEALEMFTAGALETFGHRITPIGILSTRDGVTFAEVMVLLGGVNECLCTMHLQHEKVTAKVFPIKRWASYLLITRSCKGTDDEERPISIFIVKIEQLVTPSESAANDAGTAEALH